MPEQTREFRPFSKPRHVLTTDARVLRVPDDWALLPPGDAALSRRIKQDGPTWTVIEPVGNKRFSRGIWAPAARIEALRAEIAAERADPAYARRLEAGRRRRAAAEVDYAQTFRQAVLAFLDFHPAHVGLAEALAARIVAHATPVGSGTVARTTRIPVEDRAEAATLAWMRHQTTAYDHMHIERIRGRRREVRRMLARESHRLLERYRRGDTLERDTCPLQRALAVNSPE